MPGIKKSKYFNELAAYCGIIIIVKPAKNGTIMNGIVEKLQDWRESKYSRIKGVIIGHLGRQNQAYRKAVTFVCFNAPYPLSAEALKKEITQSVDKIKELTPRLPTVKARGRPDEIATLQDEIMHYRYITAVYRDIVKWRLTMLKHGLNVTYSEILIVLRDVESGPFL
jgi:hypothetical protein